MFESDLFWTIYCEITDSENINRIIADLKYMDINDRLYRYSSREKDFFICEVYKEYLECHKNITMSVTRDISDKILDFINKEIQRRGLNFNIVCGVLYINKEGLNMKLRI